MKYIFGLLSTIKGLKIKCYNFMELLLYWSAYFETKSKLFFLSVPIFECEWPICSLVVPSSPHLSFHISLPLSFSPRHGETLLGNPYQQFFYSHSRSLEFLNNFDVCLFIARRNRNS